MKHVILLVVTLVLVIGPGTMVLTGEATQEGTTDDRTNDTITNEEQPRSHRSDSATADTSSQASQADDPGSSETVRFAVIGDYGTGDSNARDVALLVKSWNPDFIITLGDNNYPDGEAATIDQNIGWLYHEFIYPYVGNFGPGATTNRFFPTLGNHDWHTPGVQPYLDYFELPGNERYYDFTWGLVHLFALDSDSDEPDGITSDSVQGNWLQRQLAASTAPWKIVYFHHTPYSSSKHGPSTRMQWPFQEWGATAVLAGHDHVYERIIIDDFPYFTNGLGGKDLYLFGSPIPGSTVRFNASLGAMLITADDTQITFELYSVLDYNNPVDTYTIILPDGYDPLLANDDSASTDENTAVLIDVAANDTNDDGNLDPTTVTVTSAPAHGTATGNGDGSVTYRPNLGFAGSDSFIYQIADREGRTDIATVSITVSSPFVLTFTPTDDATIREDEPTLNLGADRKLEVDGSPVSDIVLQFNVSGVGTQSIAAATLRLFAVNPSPVGGDFFGTRDTTWSEDTVTWETAPSAANGSLGSLDAVETNEWYEIDVTPLVSGDGPVSIRINSVDSDGADYASRENTQGRAPELIITLHDPES